MIIRLLIAAVVSMAGITGMPTRYIDPDSYSLPMHRASTSVYFQETGHYLDEPMLGFWAEHGGVPVFGFPITPAIDQQGIVVQYFERVVLELHPENPEEWQVLPRRLGVDSLRLNRQRSGRSLPVSDVDDGVYFDQTGHSISEPFLDYWNRHGGVSVFGLPISAALTRDDITVQYFERAVLEYHEGNPEGWQIIQPRLGAAAAFRSGVDTSSVSHDGSTPIYHANLLGRGGAGAEDRVVYLTFDDGPHEEWTPRILEILALHDAKATFFVLGLNAGHYPELLDSIAAAGHALANHGFDHTSMQGMPFAEFDRQVRATEQAVPYPMVPCLRPPYGAMDANTDGFASHYGYEISLWDVDPRDWEQPGAGVIAERVLQNVHPGAVVLLHDGGGDRSQTAVALEIILDQLSAQGYQFASMCR